MTPKKDHKILENKRVKDWLGRVYPIYPVFVTGLKYMVILPAEVVREESFRGTLTAHCKLRDWLELPCPELEIWLTSNILNLNDRFSKLLAPVPKPWTIADDEVVLNWFKKAEALDKPYCEELKSLIRRRSFGIGAEPLVPKWMESVFEAVAECISMQCEPLKKWFADNVCPEIWDPALVEKAAPAVPNSQGSGSDGLTVGGTVITDSSHKSVTTKGTKRNNTTTQEVGSKHLMEEEIVQKKRPKTTGSGKSREIVVFSSKPVERSVRESAQPGSPSSSSKT